MDQSLTADRLKTLLDAVSERDVQIKKAVEAVGYPPPRERPSGFPTLLSAIVGQQVSVQAAAAILGRVVDLMDGDPAPEKIPHLSDDDLRGAGLSRQKVRYVRSLSDTVLAGKLDFSAISRLPDEEAIAAIIQVKGLGRWSAEMYMMFALGREDIWPVDDLGVQEGVARMLSLTERPKPKQLKDIGKGWKPARSVVALLAWHYYANVPL